MSDYCGACGCRQPDSQRQNLEHYTDCPEAPGGAVLFLRHTDQPKRDGDADEIESLRGKITFLREGGEKREEEFGRLRASYAGLLELEEQTVRQSDEFAARVEELEKDAIHNEGVMVALREGYTEARARVEELEKALLDANEANVAEILRELVEQHKGQFFSEEMIDAAVAFAMTMKEENRCIAWGALNKLNIFRCEGCGGPGVVDVMEPGAFLKHNEDCPGCEGHGWVIKEPT